MKVLLVEDEPTLRALLRAGLGDAGYAVDEAADGRDAHHLGDTGSYDAVVLDLGLPGGDGMRWLRQWRGAGRDMPVLILTARDGVADRVAGLDAGADDYLVKPITIDELAARLRALSRRSTGRAQSVWRHGALSYDPAGRSVRWNDQPVELTARELMLLEALMAHPGRILSKAQLQEKLYDWGESLESNTLEVHVHHLRRKLGRELIRTVRGVGYALGAAQGEEPESEPA